MKRHARPLGDELRQLRTRHGLSLRALAAQAGISNPYLSQIERGEKTPSPRILNALAGPLGVTEQHLLVLAGVIAATPTGTPGVIASDDRLTAPQRDALLAVYSAFVAANNT